MLRTLDYYCSAGARTRAMPSGASGLVISLNFTLSSWVSTRWCGSGGGGGGVEVCELSDAGLAIVGVVGDPIAGVSPTSSSGLSGGSGPWLVVAVDGNAVTVPLVLLRSSVGAVPPFWASSVATSIDGDSPLVSMVVWWSLREGRTTMRLDARAVSLGSFRRIQFT
jgi:hypothetical protein